MVNLNSLHLSIKYLRRLTALVHTFKCFSVKSRT